MEKSFVIIKFSEENVVLYNEEANKELLWPISFLPQDLKIGEKINFIISLDNLETVTKRKQSIDILNEILTVEEDH
jgi:hypothetical protein